MTDAEIDALAREILTYTVTEVLDWHPDIPHHVLRLPDGELRPVWATVSYVFEFLPLEMIKAIIVECGKILDEFVLSLEAQKNLSKHNKRYLRTYYKKGRARTVKMMAQQASLHMIAFFHNRLADMLDEVFEDGKVIAESYLGVTFAKMLDPYAPEPVKLDASKGIKAAGERVAANKERFLRGSIEFLPFLSTKKRRGRPPKPPSAREKQRKEFSAQIEATYLKLRSATGKAPSKRTMAKELRTGGINPRTGTDSRLNALNLKLKRLGIDYDAIAAKMDAEG